MVSGSIPRAYKEVFMEPNIPLPGNPPEQLPPEIININGEPLPPQNEVI
jgi:hypothetical protein